MLRNIVAFALAIVGLMMIPGCEQSFARDAGFRTWQEEVKLNDGRVIVVTQKRRCESAYTGANYAPCISREAWLTIKLPEFGNKEIVWHEKLKPMVVNVDEGQFYIVGRPPTGREFDLYGRPQPPYLGYRWEEGEWKRIAFDKIPEAIYEGNMIIDLPPNQTRLLTLAQKGSQELNGSPEYRKHVKRIVPGYKSNFH